jgi:molybdopterin biosynthesis enzyme
VRFTPGALAAGLRIRFFFADTIDLHRGLLPAVRRVMYDDGASALSSNTRGDGFVIVRADSEGFARGADVEVWLYA